MHLERADYLRQEPDPADSRARLIRLTPSGLGLEQDVRAASARVHLDWRERLGPRRFDDLWAALQDVTGRSGAAPDVTELRQRAGSSAP